MEFGVLALIWRKQHVCYQHVLVSVYYFISFLIYIYIEIPQRLPFLMTIMLLLHSFRLNIHSFKLARDTLIKNILVF